MRTIAKVILWISGVLLVISTAFQLLAMLAGVLANGNLTAQDRWLIPAWISGLALLLIAFVLSACLSDKGNFPLLFAGAALIGAVLMLLVALWLQQKFPTHIGVDGSTEGLTVWRMCYRHYSSVLVGVLTAVADILQIFVNRAAKRRRDLGEDEPHFDLSGKPVFRDESTIGLEHFGTDEAPKSRRQKRSVRDAMRKNGDM